MKKIRKLQNCKNDWLHHNTDIFVLKQKQRSNQSSIRHQVQDLWAKQKNRHRSRFKDSEIRKSINDRAQNAQQGYKRLERPKAKRNSIFKQLQHQLKINSLRKSKLLSQLLINEKKTIKTKSKVKKWQKWNSFHGISVFYFIPLHLTRISNGYIGFQSLTLI